MSASPGPPGAGSPKASCMLVSGKPQSRENDERPRGTCSGNRLDLPEDVPVLRACAPDSSAQGTRQNWGQTDGHRQKRPPHMRRHNLSRRQPRKCISYSPAHSVNRFTKRRTKVHSRHYNVLSFISLYRKRGLPGCFLGGEMLHALCLRGGEHAGTL